MLSKEYLQYPNSKRPQFARVSKSIMIHHCGAAEMSSPINVVLQMKEKVFCLFGIDLNKCHIVIVVIFVVLSNHNIIYVTVIQKLQLPWGFDSAGLA